MPNIAEVLVKENKQELVKDQEFVEFAKEITSKKHKEDVDRLSHLGFHVPINEITTQHYKLTKKLEAPEKVISFDAIGKIAMKYRLRFLSVTQYKGNIPVELIAKIEEFKKEYRKVVPYKHLTDVIIKENLYILAPASSFNLEVKQKDPILFFRMNQNRTFQKDTFYLIHKWGNDISWWRKLVYLPLRNGWWWSVFNFIGFLLSVLLLVFIFTHIDHSSHGQSILGFMGILFSITILVVWGSVPENDKLSSQSWTSKWR